VRVRSATVDDAEALAGIHVRGWQWGYRGQLPGDYLNGLSIDRRTEQWRGWLLDPGATATWLAEDDASGVARPLGFAAAGASRDPDAPADTAEVYAIYVEEGAAGKGVGSALLEHACARIADEGFSHATLWVLETNARARRFYERAGWRPDGEAKSEPREDFDMREVRYVADLTADRRARGA
jgi:GNAT superfamily N-acetyltransferase